MDGLFVLRVFVCGQSFLEVFFNIADALEIDPADLINASVFPDKVIRNNLKG